MSNDDAWSGADKLPPMVYVPPPDADAPAGRGGVIGLIVLLFTIIAIIVAGLFSVENWVYSRNLANPANWASLALDGGDFGLRKVERATTGDADRSGIQQLEQNLRLQNRALCAQPMQVPLEIALPNLEQQVDQSRSAYDVACQNSATPNSCRTGANAPPPPVVITPEQRQALCTKYATPK